MLIICHGSNSQLQILVQLHMLIIGQPDKMLRDVRNSKRNREISATLMGILVSGENFTLLTPNQQSRPDQNMDNRRTGNSIV